MEYFGLKWTPNDVEVFLMCSHGSTVCVCTLEVKGSLVKCLQYNLEWNCGFVLLFCSENHYFNEVKFPFLFGICWTYRIILMYFPFSQFFVLSQCHLTHCSLLESEMILYGLYSNDKNKLYLWSPYFLVGIWDQNEQKQHTWTY